MLNIRQSILRAVLTPKRHWHSSGNIAMDWCMKIWSLILCHLSDVRTFWLFIDNTISIICFRWEFKTEDYDIGFGVNYVCDGKKTPVVPIKRVNSHAVAEDGSVFCEQPGTCKLLYTY